ncbi:MAG TPA: hypothetical protein VMZ29_00095 [Candidatus Bathyarchaeia archaeon]|nr:hypothetical protein [Candidatus Bathyarchaeia archaeon]
MKLMRVIIGSIIGSLISAGVAIGLIYGGIRVAWWLAIILSGIGTIIGGFIAGWISQDRFPGMIAGALTGMFVFGAVVLWSWLVLRTKIMAWWDSFADINSVITELLGFLNVEPTSGLGMMISDKINELYITYAADMDAVIANYVPKFCLILGAIFGGMALIMNTIAGRIGGRLNKIDEITGT